MGDEKEKPNVKDVFVENGEFQPSRMRGIMLQWIKSLDEGYGGVNVNPGDDELKIAYADFEQWVSQKTSGDWWTFKEGVDVDVEDIFVDFFESNDDFRQRLLDNIKVVGRDGKIYQEGITEVRGEDREGMYHGGGDSDGGGDEVSGSHEYKKLYNAGIVTDDGVDYGKLMGTLILFSKEVDVIEGKKEELTVKEYREAWSRWMLDKIGGNWPKFEVSKVDHDDVEEWIEDFKEDRNGFWDRAKSKYEKNEELLEGNSDRKSRRERKKKQSITNWDNVESTEESGKDKSAEEEEPEETPIQEEKEDGGRRIEESGVIRGDSIEVLSDIEGRPFNALITDPPYGQNYDSRGEEHDVIEADDDLDQAVGLTEDVAKKARLCLKKGSPIVMFAGDSNLCQVKNIIDRWYDYKGTYIWDKDWIGSSSIADNPIRFRKKHEYFVLGMYGKPKMENPNRHDGSIVKFRRPGGDNRVHPTEKPVELMEYVIESFTEQGDMVLDPFAGSGSTLVAARRSSREYFGIELDKKYYDAIQERLNQNTLSAWGD